MGGTNFTAQEMFGDSGNSKTYTWNVHIRKPDGGRAFETSLRLASPDRAEALRRAKVLYSDLIPAGGDIEVEPSSTFSAEAESQARRNLGNDKATHDSQ